MCSCLYTMYVHEASMNPTLNNGSSAMWCFEHDSFGICDGIIDFYMKLLHICIWTYLRMNMPLPAWSSHKCLDVEVNGAVFLWEQWHLHSTAQLVAGRMATQYRRSHCELQNVYVLCNLTICAISRLRCTFSES